MKDVTHTPERAIRARAHPVTTVFTTHMSTTTITTVFTTHMTTTTYQSELSEHAPILFEKICVPMMLKTERNANTNNRVLHNGAALIFAV